MTEERAIEVLEIMKSQLKDFGMTAKFKGVMEMQELAIDIALKSLTEIQQYRAIGTVEECWEARERQRAKKPIYSYLKSLPTCPNCGEVNLQHENEYGKADANHVFCPDCGQSIDWSDTP